MNAEVAHRSRPIMGARSCRVMVRKFKSDFCTSQANEHTIRNLCVFQQVLTNVSLNSIKINIASRQNLLEAQVHTLAGLPSVDFISILILENCQQSFSVLTP